MAGGISFKYVYLLPHNGGCPILAFFARVGTSDLYAAHCVEFESVPPTLSHKTRKDGAPSLEIVA